MFEFAKKIMEDCRILKVGHDLLNDALVLKNKNIHLSNVFDTQIASRFMKLKTNSLMSLSMLLLR